MDRLTDARLDPDISPQVVFRALLYGFDFRTPSLKQLEADVDGPYFQRWIGAPRASQDDVFRYSLCAFDLDPLEQMLVGINIASLTVIEGELPRRALVLVGDWGALHQAELLENWRLCPEKAPPGKIEPLA